MKESFLELLEEIEDFIEDFCEQIFRTRKKSTHKVKKLKLYGTEVSVRLAFVFAERVENLLKLIFGCSICVSAIVSSFWGLTGLSDLLKVLINSLFGRIVMFTIGFCYLIIGVWKILHLKKTPLNKRKKS